MIFIAKMEDAMKAKGWGTLKKQVDKSSWTLYINNKFSSNINNQAFNVLTIQNGASSFY